MLDQFARAATYLLSPLAVPPLLLWFVLSWVGAPTGETVLIVGLTAVFLFAVPGTFLLWMVKSGRSETLNLEDRRHRTQAMAIGMLGAIVLAGAAFALSTTTRYWTTALVVAYLLSSGVLALINRQWRISLHMASISGLVSVVLFMRTASDVVDSVGGLQPGHIAVAGSLAVLAVGWSRLRLRAHTPAQVIVGAGVGVVLPYLLLTLFTALPL